MKGNMEGVCSFDQHTIFYMGSGIWTIRIRMEQGYASSYGEAILRGVYLTPYEFVWSRIWNDHTRGKRGLNVWAAA
jgi:hypothetical protein